MSSINSHEIDHFSSAMLNLISVAEKYWPKIIWSLGEKKKKKPLNLSVFHSKYKNPEGK